MWANFHFHYETNAIGRTVKTNLGGFVSVLWSLHSCYRCPRAWAVPWCMKLSFRGWIVEEQRRWHYSERILAIIKLHRGECEGIRLVNLEMKWKKRSFCVRLARCYGNHKTRIKNSLCNRPNLIQAFENRSFGVFLVTGFRECHWRQRLPFILYIWVRIMLKRYNVCTNHCLQ